MRGNRFDDEVEDEVAKKGCGQKLKGFGRFIWNSENKEFCGRDGASWAKISLFYGIFYTCLGGFFIGMLAIFMELNPNDMPKYYGQSSTMNNRNCPLNPGLGFRPQIDPEDNLINYDPKSEESSLKFINSIKNFLDTKYKTQEDSNTIDCSDKDENEFKEGKSCKFNHVELFKDTNCTHENGYGFKTEKPCILIKLNKIVSWVPSLGENGTYISIRCEGENSFDKDNLKNVMYHSEDSLNNEKEGQLPSKYYPFWGRLQSSYRPPFIWATFDVTPNTLVNIECKAYANNIDNSDRLNRRGQTKFSLFFTSK